MLAEQIMTSHVITVSPQTSISEIAELMTRHRISGLPVLGEDGNLVGIVSETDLLHRAETATEKQRKWWVALFLDPDMRARDFIKVHGRTAADVMSHFVISIPHDAPLATVANILEANNLKRAPVLKQGKLVGIITRGDLVKAFVDADAMRSAPHREPGALQKAINDRLAKQSWLNPTYINVIVTDEAVEIRGIVQSEDQHRALEILVAELAGSRRVESHVTVGPRGRMPAV